MVKTLTDAAPDFLRTLEQAPAVEPVVRTSSTRMTFFPDTRSAEGAEKTPRRIFRLAEAGRRVCGEVEAPRSRVEAKANPKWSAVLWARILAWSNPRSRHRSRSMGTCVMSESLEIISGYSSLASRLSSEPNSVASEV
jgi:hypothetical protein